MKNMERKDVYLASKPRYEILAERSYAAYTVIGGWSTTPDQLQIGFTRLLYPFFCGLLISRMGRLI